MKTTLGQCAIGALLLAIVAWLAAMHDVSGAQMAESPRLAWAGAVGAAWIAMTAMLVRPRREAQTGLSATPPEVRELTAPLRDRILVVHASQTGFASELAGRTADVLRAGGIEADVRPMATLAADDLLRATRALFVVSTTGEGDAPDDAMAFRRASMRAPLELQGLAYGTLALGDRDYEDFCAFGHDLDRWLHASGAAPLFDLVEVDNGDQGALRHWQHHVAQLSGAVEQPDWARPAYQPWRLVERRLLNAGSAGGPCFHIALVPEDSSLLAWAAGDIAEIGPRRADGDAAALPHREYSIASVPSDGALHLVVRQMRHADGSLGPGSGWLTEYAALDGVIDVRVRRNEGFHAPADDRPVLLIGNGTGIAGLRALLKERIARGHVRNWLVYGERHADVDRLHIDDLERWQATGGLERLDLVWSRQSQPVRYVQDRLRAMADDVRRFVADGASIHVCGSLAGMAPGVDAALRAILGDAGVDDLAAQGRYRRDVY